MHLDFASSARSTLGIEWEIALVDRQTGDLVSAAGEILEELRGGRDEHPHITGELLLNTVELVSGVHTRVSDAVDELRGLLDEVRVHADPRGIELMCAGSHPFGQWFDQAVTDKERYHTLIERTQWWGRNMMIWGVHVHVGIEDPSKVIPLLHGLLTYLPHFQALSASSPFWAGEATGYASNRALMFQQLPTAGLPFDVADWTAFEGFVDDLTRTGVVSGVDEVRWDVRPSPRWGTLEMRACDGLSSPEEVGAVAALVQCLVESMSRELDAGRPLTVLPPWFVKENKWRAARYGLDAEIILDPAGAERLVTDELIDLVDRLLPLATELGCEAELADIPRILASGGSSRRQLAVARDNAGDLRAVVAALTDELRTGLRL